ncbi:hypothetical protein ACB098_10G002900 [Castanea mollissima]
MYPVPPTTRTLLFAIYIITLIVDLTGPEKHADYFIMSYYYCRILYRRLPRFLLCE